jgi:hypothetical protein
MGGGNGRGGRVGGGTPPANMTRSVGSTMRGGPGGGGGGMSLLFGSTSNATLTAALKKDASSFTWVAATVGSNTAAGYQLAAEEPVMAIGGFNGTDPAPTLAQFQQYVKDGKIHYFIGGGTTSDLRQPGLPGDLRLGPGELHVRLPRRHDGLRIG